MLKLGRVLPHRELSVSTTSNIMSSSSSSSSSPPLVPQPSSNVPVLSEFLRGEEEHCRVWLRAEMNQIPDQLIESLFHGQISSSSSSSAVPQSRSTVSEMCELLEGKKVEVSRVMRGEMDRVLNDLFEGLTNKLMAYTDLDRSEDGGVGARVESNDLEGWKPRLFTEDEIKNELEYGNVDELFAELGLPNQSSQSADLFSPSTSTGQDSIRTDLTQQATVSIHRNGTKRKQTRSDRTVKRSKKTLHDGDGEDGEYIVNEDREEENGTKRKQPSSNRTLKRSGQEPIGEQIAPQPTTNPIQPNLAQPNRQFQCSHCHKSFDRKDNLQRHVRVHTGERPFHCDLCDQRFTQKVNLDAHLRTHSGDRPFACRHCEMSFAHLNARHNHEQSIHLKVKPYRCKQCGKTATEQSAIIRHIRMVHFSLPQTIKEQRELNIVDERDPRELVEKV